MRGKQEASRTAKFLVWVIGWMVVLVVAKTRATGGGRPEEGIFQAYFKSRPSCIWRQEGRGILKDVRSEQVEGMGSWALGRLRNDRVTGWGEDGQGDQGWSE